MEIATPIWLMTITSENLDSLSSIRKWIMYKKVKMYTHGKLQKYLYTNPHTPQKAHSYTHYTVSWTIFEPRFSQIQNRTACSKCSWCTGREEGGREGVNICFIQFKLSCFTKFKLYKISGFPQQGISTL